MSLQAKGWLQCEQGPGPRGPGRKHLGNPDAAETGARFRSSAPFPLN